jgi:hypothetical protein
MIVEITSSKVKFWTVCGYFPVFPNWVIVDSSLHFNVFRKNFQQHFRISTAAMKDKLNIFHYNLLHSQSA